MEQIRILLIDDDEDDFIITQDLLTDLGYQPGKREEHRFKLEWLDNYIDGQIAIDQNRHDVYLVDYRLGEQNGLELIREAIKRGCSAPLILLTGQGDREVDLEAMQAGAADYLVKGQMDAPLFERSIRYALERQRTQIEIQRRNRELGLLNHVIAASATTFELENILQTTCRELCLTFDLPQSAALLLNQKRTTATVVAEHIPENLTSLVNVTIPVKGNAFFEYLLINKAPLIIHDVLNDSRLQAVQQLLHQGQVKSILFLPIIINDDVEGAIILNTYKPHKFTTDEINLAWSVTDQIAGALSNARLTQAHQRLITAIEQSAESVVITDTKGIIVYINPAFERTTGYTWKDAVGQNTSILNSQQQDKEFYKELWSTIASGNVWRGRFINKKKDGNLYTEDATITPVRNEHNVIVNYVNVARDITHELQLEEQLRQSQKMDAIGQLAGGVAHDFNNLLTAIMSYAGLALETLPPDQFVYEDIKGIQKTAERAATLTRQLLAFARQQVSQPRVIDINDSILNMDKLLRRLIGADVELVTLPATSLGRVKIDPGQFEQILVNLVVNARDAMPNGGKLLIETANVVLDHNYAQGHAEVIPGNYVMMVVTDNGTGISKDIQARIFEPFFTTKEVGKGTGLGLATCFGIVKQSKGHIWVYSEPKHGTTFKVYLPCIDKEHVLPSKSAPAHHLPGGTETILLVEDETTVRNLASRTLRQRGYTILEATNGEEALNIVREQKDTSIDLILTDIVMPKMGGAILVKKLIPDYPGLKVLFISGYSDNAVIHNDMLEAKYDFLQKPFTPEQLAHKVREVLNQLQT